MSKNHKPVYDRTTYHTENLSVMNRRYLGKMQEQQDQIAELKNLLSLQRHRNSALELELTSSRNHSDELQNQINEANLQIAVHWGADEDTDSVLKDIEKALCGCKHEHNGMMYMSNPLKYKCKKCGEFYLSNKHD